MPNRSRPRRVNRVGPLVALLLPALSCTATAGAPHTASPSAAIAPDGRPLLDINYVYSLIDDTNHSTDPADGRSWAVRYYHRVAGQAGETAGGAKDVCTVDPSTGRNTAAIGGSTKQNCWWEFMSAWKREMSRQPGLTPANVTDHVFRVAETDPNPYVSSASGVAADAAANPGPQNVIIVTIPGAVHPEQTVVIGEHPDAATISAFGSAYDDGQGAAEVAGIARTLLAYWTSHHLWPARTVQFVLFDGEEQGLFGSFFYQSQLIPPGAVDANQYAAMYNVDSNGMGYPARHLGLPDHPGQGPWYFYIQETPLSDFSLYHRPDGSPYPRVTQNRAAIQHFHDSTNAAVQLTWTQLNTLYRGKPMPLATYPTGVPYPTGCVVPATCVDTFQSRSDMRYLLQVDDIYGGTDQDPFIRCGIPAYGLDGGTTTDQFEPIALPNRVRNPAPGVPFTGYDTPIDNIGSLNFLASGRGSPYGIDISPANELDASTLGSEALRRSLLLTGQLVVNQSLMPDSAGAVAAPTHPIAHFLPDRFQLHAGESTRFHATPGPVPATASWQFDDGSTATGSDIVHRFATVGLHPVRLTVTAPTGTATYTAAIRVVLKGADANTNCGQVAAETSVVPAATSTSTPAATLPSTAAGITPNTTAAPAAPASIALVAIATITGAARRRRRRHRGVDR